MLFCAVPGFCDLFWNVIDGGKRAGQRFHTSGQLLEKGVPIDATEHPPRNLRIRDGEADIADQHTIARVGGARGGQGAQQHW